MLPVCERSIDSEATLKQQTPNAPYVQVTNLMIVVTILYLVGA